MFVEKDKRLIDEFHIRSGHSINSIKAYRTVFRKYIKFHSMNLHELLGEAIYEQENGVPENRLSIYDRILSFRNHLVENNVGSTINNSISKIKTFYRYNRVYLPFIPPLNGKYVKKNDIIGFEDLLTKDELKQALNAVDDDIKLWILVMLSSGASRMDAKSMTNRMFFRGTAEYHRKDDFESALRYLSRKNNVVCTCRLIMQKTDKPYYTFLNPECVQKIAKVKLRQGDFDLNASLLKYSPNHLSHKFKAINDILGLGSAGGYSRFRPHMIRKFHATHLNQGSIDEGVLDMDNIDSLHGRGNNTREAYFKENPEYLKFEYIKVMGNVSLHHRYVWKSVRGKIKVRAISI